MNCSIGRTAAIGRHGRAPCPSPGPRISSFPCVHWLIIPAAPSLPANPANPADYPAETFDIAPGGSLRIVASARNHAGSEIALAEEIEARALNGSLLASSDRALLRTTGFDFRSALDLVEAAKPAMTVAANSIYQRHVDVSASTPGILLPIDALRILLRGGAAPSGYTGAVSPANANAALSAYNSALSSAAQSFRPQQTWTLEILENPPSRGVYQDQFEFVLESRTTLAGGSFIEVSDTPINSLGADELRASIPQSAAPAGKCFYRIRVRLK